MLKHITLIRFTRSPEGVSNVPSICGRMPTTPCSLASILSHLWRSGEVPTVLHYTGDSVVIQIRKQGANVSREKEQVT